MNKINAFFSKGIPNHFKRAIVAGILVMIPLIVTFLLLKMVFEFVDGVLQPVLVRVFGREILGLGLLTLMLLVYVVGLFWIIRIGRRVIRTIQELIVKIPIIGAVYSPARKLIESFTGGDGMSGFKRVVLIEYPRQEVWSLGFLTGVTEAVPARIMGIVYLPTAPTPNSGYVAILPIQQIYATDMTVNEAMGFVLSGGITSPARMPMKALDDAEIALLRNKATGGPVNNPDSGAFQLPFIKKTDLGESTGRN
ncbi:MAG: DUF502 domain-containing protein [SAR202 cluster bacterium]|nr:DUF502 domain-containing protein [SAR202 cluster bacterium]